MIASWAYEMVKKLSCFCLRMMPHQLVITAAKRALKFASSSFSPR